MKTKENCNIRVQGGSLQGHSHLNNKKNCQDAFQFELFNDCCFGIVSDGCGESKHSEIGSVLTTRFLSKCLLDYYNKCANGDNNLRLGYFQAILFTKLKEYLTRTIDDLEYSNATYLNASNSYPNIVNDLFLATVLGFYWDSTDFFIFYSRDGVYAINNDELINLDNNGSPPFPAYSTFPVVLTVEKEFIIHKFELLSFPAENIKRVMIGTDGFLTSVNKLPSLHGQQWGHPGNLGLKLWMNRQFKEGHFDDDCTLVVAERK